MFLHGRPWISLCGSIGASMNVALRPPDFFRLFAPGCTRPDPPPIPSNPTGPTDVFVLGHHFPEPPVFVAALSEFGRQQLYDERCLARPPDSALSSAWPTPKSELKRCAGLI